jgi:phenylacetate-CoA ligase
VPSALSIYFACPIWLQNALITGYGVHLRRLRYGARHRRFLAELVASQRDSRDVQERRQLDHLNSAITHAYDTVSLYRDRGPRPLRLGRLDELRDLPFVTKADLQRPRAAVVSDAYATARLKEIHTGGTTGKPLVVYCDSRTLQLNYAFFARFLGWCGVGPRPRTAIFAGRPVARPAQSEPPFWRRNLAANALLFSSYHISEPTIPAYIEELARWGPEVIDSYPSSVAPIARHLLHTADPRIRPRAVITSSETLTHDDRTAIEAAFSCRVFDYYGAAEMVAFITQCRAGRYHPNSEFGIVEVLREDLTPAGPGEEGEIVATGFVNPVMPLLRYRTGDLAVPAAGPCPCGLPYPSIERLVGRLDDVVITPSGRRVGRLDPIFKSVHGFIEAQIVQDQLDHVRMDVVAAGPLPEATVATLRRELALRLGPEMRIDIQRTEAIPRTGRGKLRSVVRAVDVPPSSSAAGPTFARRHPDRTR